MSSAAALRASVAGLVVGLLAQYLFVRELLGLNLLVAVAAGIALAWPSRRSGPRSRDARLLGSLAFGLFAAMRTEAAVQAFDAVAAVALLVLWVVPSIADIPEAAALRAVSAYAAAVPAARERLPRSARPLRFAAGGVLAIPLLLVFGSLFGAADAVFDRSLRDLFALEWLRELVRDLPLRVLVAAVVAWSATGLLAPSKERLVDLRSRAFLSSDTAVATLAAIITLFAVFVALQIAYLFGGRDTLDAAGITYSAYARRGFFELVAVVSLVGMLLFVFGLIVAERGRTYAVAALVLIALTAIVLASAAYRMSLYQQAYGWSELRLYANAFIAFLALSLAMLAGAVLTGRIERVPGQLVAAAAVVAIAVNVIGPAHTVAAQNIDRFLDPTGLPADAYRALDVGYLVSLGDGAVPVIAERFADLPAAERGRVVDELRRTAARRATTGDWQSWNWDRSRATQALSGR